MKKTIKKNRSKRPVHASAKKGMRVFAATLFFALAIAVLIGLPLLTVWKQVYITTASVRTERLTDSLSVLNGRLARLRLAAEELAATERIEKIARERLALDYPDSREIIVMKQKKKPLRPFAPNWRFLAVLRKSFVPDKG